jgi:hypothetical protein
MLKYASVRFCGKQIRRPRPNPSESPGSSGQWFADLTDQEAEPLLDKLLNSGCLAARAASATR